MENSFGDWIQQEIKRLNWRQADLARAANLDSAVISNLINGRRGPGEDTCKAIARALNYPPETVFRAAGLLPPAQPIDDQRAELNYLFDNASDQKRDEMLRYARYLAQEAGKKFVPGH